ncbi:hypothetical protein BX600DRAFT_525554 [Xylariales sp. PMI_506]|nr:hypothetical protein BX600DRAFT_525554 [Xylariales sp. PMI_506]
MAHARRFKCEFPGCQHPPLASKNALQNHIRKNHTVQIFHRPIARLRSRSLSARRSESQIVYPGLMRLSGDSSTVRHPHSVLYDINGSIKCEPQAQALSQQQQQQQDVSQYPEYNGTPDPASLPSSPYSVVHDTSYSAPESPDDSSDYVYDRLFCTLIHSTGIQSE